MREGWLARGHTDRPVSDLPHRHQVSPTASASLYVAVVCAAVAPVPRDQELFIS